MQYEEYDHVHLSEREPDNERAIVLQFRWGDTAFLLPSDIGEPTESTLASRHKDLQSGVLLAPHHGSPYSGSQRFLQAVRPVTVIISTGRSVRDDVLERYRQTGAAVWRTDRARGRPSHYRRQALQGCSLQKPMIYIAFREGLC